MDTPEKNQICAPVSEFEDSPVFNYINSLSPIKPVKSLHTTQALNSLSFASPPSVSTSPHASSIKESGFLRRHQFATLSKPEFSSTMNGDNTSEEISAVRLAGICAEELGNLFPGNATAENVSEPPNECIEFASELQKTLKHDACTPDVAEIHCKAGETYAVPERTSVLASVDQFLEVDLKERCHSFQNELELHNIFKLEHEVAECSSGGLIFDDADLLIFNSTIKEEHFKGHEQDCATVDPGKFSFLSTVLELPQGGADDLHDDVHIPHAVGAIGSHGQREMEVFATRLEKVKKQTKTAETRAIFSGKIQDGQLVSISSASSGNKGKHFIWSGCKQCSIRRRCLVFEKAGTFNKISAGHSNGSSSDSFHSDCKRAPDENKFVQMDIENECLPSKVPGIDLHLNAVASTSKDGKVDGPRTLASGRHLIRSIEGYIVPTQHHNKLVEDASQTSAGRVSEELNPSSLKKKRRCAFDHDGESLACKRCSCKKSKCLKLYCECFAAGLYCIEPCSCQNCHNRPLHEETVLETRKQIESRDPLAFAPRVIHINDSAPEFGEESNKTPASGRHKRGCNCKKSSCLKKYCECFQAGVGCSVSCRCERCRNTFGQKDEETEEAEERGDTENSEIDTSDTVLLNNLATKNEEENAGHVPTTPPSSKIVRHPIQMAYTFSSKPLGSSLLAVGSPPQPKHRKCLQMIHEEGIPETMDSNPSLGSVVKSASQSCKRVSPPQHKTWRNGRKLILRSIPSFPSLLATREVRSPRQALF